MAYDDGPYDVSALHGRALTGPLSDGDRAWAVERAVAIR
jgi:hypothetical protein